MSSDSGGKLVSNWFTRNIHPAFSLAVLVPGIMLAVLVYGIILQWETRARRAEFEWRAGVYAEALQRKLQRQGATISMVASLFRIYGEVDAEEFRNFVEEPLNKHGEVEFFDWIVLNTPEEQYTETKTDPGEKGNQEGKNLNGKIRRLYRHPRPDRVDDGQNGQLLREDCADLLKSIVAENDVSVGGGQTLVHTQAGSPQYSLVIPIFSQTDNVSERRLKGVLRMVCDIGKTVETAIAGRMPKGLDLYIYDTGLIAQEEPLYVRKDGSGHRVTRGQDNTTIKRRYALSLASQRWFLLVRPSPEFLRKSTTWQPLIMAGLVGGFAFMASLFLWVVASKEQETKKLAKDRADVISRLKNTESRLRETLTDLRRAEHILADQERQKALSSVAKGIAHDFNNALSPVRGYADLLLENGDKLTDENTLRKYVKRIKKATEVATETVRRMSKFYHGEGTENHVPLDVNDLVTKAVDSAQLSEAKEKGKQINWVKEIQSDGKIFAVEDEVCEMLTNILHNSVDSIEEEGTIWVRTYSAKNHIVIEIEDDGKGMDEEVLSSCVDPFYTTKGPDRRGLGLSVSEGIAARHGGSLSVDSELSGGTIVQIKWPTASTMNDGQCEMKGDSLPEGLRFLVVENQRLERTLLRDLLRSLGYVVNSCSTAEAAMAEYTQQDYDIVIVSTHLQDMTARELVHEFSSPKDSSIIIILTDRAFEEEEEWESSGLVDGFLSKPIQLESLRSTICKVVSEG